ncbi:MAG: hypothetical protein K6E40_08640 [Desulfovibrio sp.]|nr:hypothetical protein [Desulfovibrio sp.]
MFCIAGATHPQLKEKIVLLHEEEAAPAELVARARSDLPRHWVPRTCFKVDAVPRTGTGKSARQEARDLAERLCGSCSSTPATGAGHAGKLHRIVQSQARRSAGPLPSTLLEASLPGTSPAWAMARVPFMPASGLSPAQAALPDSGVKAMREPWPRVKHPC